MSNNIVLVGLPCCGKTTLGKIVAEKLSMNFIDIDQLVIENNPIRETDLSILNAIRRVPMVEHEIVRNLKNETQPALVATGADTLNEWENTENLRKFGLVIYIKRDRNLLLEKAKERFPFVSTSDDGEKEDASGLIFSQYEKTVYLYENAADVSFVNEGTIEESAEKLINLIAQHSNKNL
ncbi:MAG: AAA family ATPase [Planctomycetaceae bacterium]|jgi:shikimate kinase|nr:AAA family ATPase [Planctomycetaceae bacterium]